MLEGSDLNLNSVECCTNSTKEEVKQTMLNQELVFMKQVYELHRLYRIQVATSEDLKQNGFYNNILRKGGVNSISVNMSQSNGGKCSGAEFIQSDNFNLKQEWHRLPGFTQKPLDLQLPADEFISYCAKDFSGAGVHRGSFQHSFGSMSSSQGEAVLGLSLGIVHDPGKNPGEPRTWMGKQTCAPSSNVIDLEDPEFCFADSHASPRLRSGFSSHNIYSKGKHKLEILSPSGKRNVSYGTSSSISVMDIGPSSHRKASCDSGHKGKHKESLFSEIFSNNQHSAISKGNNIDLNVLQQPEETSYFSNNHSMVLNLSPTSFSDESKKVNPNSTVAPFATPTTWRSEANASHYFETSKMCQKREMDLNLTASYEEKDEGKSCKDGKFREVDGGKISFIDLDSSDPDEELCSNKSDPKIESVGSLSKLSNGHSCEASIERDVNFSTCDESLKDQRSSDSSESKIQGIVEKEPQLDEAIQTAAELLVQISSEAMKLGSKELQNKEEENQPQCSSESYEAMVLRAIESEPPDDCFCVSSNAFVVDISEKEDIKYKLKRGTRMKDFQKDILPCLSTLSRQEIREDINIMDGVIRSREYRKMRAKMGDGDHEWSRPTRSKRSRGSYSRRYYN